MNPKKTASNLASHSLHSSHLALAYFQDGEQLIWPIHQVCEQLRMDWQQESEKLQSLHFQPIELNVRMQSSRGQVLHTCLEQGDFNL